MSTERRLTIDNGKYTFILPEGDYRVHVLRHGEEWLVIEQGSKAIWSLVYDAIDAVALVGAVKAWAAASHSGREGELISALWKYQEERGEKQVTPPFEAAPLTAGPTPADVVEARRTPIAPGRPIPDAALAEIVRANSHCLPEHRTEALEMALELQQRRASSAWRTGVAPRGVRCLVTAPHAGSLRALVASISHDHQEGGYHWFSDGVRIHGVIAWMPLPEPAGDSKS